jgi:hypothetical protein
MEPIQPGLNCPVMTQLFAGPQVHRRNYGKQKESRFDHHLDCYPIYPIVRVCLPMAQAQKAPTRKEFKTLLKTAKEPSEHLKIAECYRQAAARLTASSKEHAKLADTHAKTVPDPIEPKRGDTFGQGAGHCKKWAELQAQEAKEAEALAG